MLSLILALHRHGEARRKIVKKKTKLPIGRKKKGDCPFVIRRFTIMPVTILKTVPYVPLRELCPVKRKKLISFFLSFHRVTCITANGKSGSPFTALASHRPRNISLSLSPLHCTISSFFFLDCSSRIIVVVVLALFLSPLRVPY